MPSSARNNGGNPRRAYDRIGSSSPPTRSATSSSSSNPLNDYLRPDSEDDDFSDIEISSNNENEIQVVDITTNSSTIIIMEGSTTQRSLNQPLSEDEDDEENQTMSSPPLPTSRQQQNRNDGIRRAGSIVNVIPSPSPSRLIVPEKHKITLTILDSAQKKFELIASRKWTTKQLKIEGERIHSIQPSQQRLISMGKLLQDEIPLDEQGITKNGAIIHLFPKPNVVISNDGPDRENRNSGNGNSNHNPNSQNGGSSNSEGGAHVPQIIVDSEELSRRGQILVLSSHEAYEAMHRVRLLSFLLLAYSTLQILRDVTIYLAPAEGYLNDDVIPPGDPTDTSSSSYTDEDQLPKWESRYYVELLISFLGVYVALLGMRVTQEHVGDLARRFLFLLGILGLSWTLFTFYCHVIYNISLEKALGETDKDHLALRVSLLETVLPFFMWVLFYIRALQFYTLIREAELESTERAMTLLPTQSDDNNDANGNNNESRGDRNNVNEHDLELQVEGRTIT